MEAIAVIVEVAFAGGLLATLGVWWRQLGKPQPVSWEAMMNERIWDETNDDGRA